MDVEKVKKAINAIGEKEGRPKGVFTMKELARALGTSVENTREKMGDLVETGKAEFAGKFPSRTITGSISRVPMYRMVK